MLSWSSFFNKVNIYPAEESKKKLCLPEKSDARAIAIHLLKSQTTCETEAKRCIKCGEESCRGGGGVAVRRRQHTVWGRASTKTCATCLEKEEDIHIWIYLPGSVHFPYTLWRQSLWCKKVHLFVNSAYSMFCLGFLIYKKMSYCQSWIWSQGFDIGW